MQPSNRALRSASLVTSPAALLVAASLASPLSADFVIRSYASSSNYELRISHLTDLDQRRTGLAATSGGTPGGMFCVPTSSANAFTYIAQHGYAYCDPGDRDWQSSSNHALATTFIARLGAEMSTSGTGGTSASNAFKGLKRVLKQEVGSRFVVSQELHSYFNSLSFRDMIKHSIDRRAIQQFCYGRYDVLGTNTCGETVIRRNGGHCMTLVRGKRSAAGATVTYHDPDGTGDSWSAQSAFTPTTKDVVSYGNLVIHGSVTGSCLFGDKATMVRIMRNLDDGDYRLLDSRFSVRPASGYSWKAFTGAAGGGFAIDRLECTYEEGTLEATTATLALESSDATLVVSPDGVPFLVVPGVGIFAENAGATAAGLVPVPLDGLGAGAVDEAVFAGDRTLVVRSGSSLVAIGGLAHGVSDDPEAEAPSIAWRAEVPFAPAKLVASHRAQSGEDGDAPHAVLAFSSDLRLAYEVSGDESVAPRLLELPADLLIDAELGEARGTIVVEDGAGGLLFAQPGSPRVTRFDTRDGAVREFILPIGALGGFAIDDLGNMLVVDDGIVRSFIETPKGVIENGIEGSPFAGQRVGRGFTVDRSSTNHEARFHAGPEWSDRPEDDAPRCPADLDGDGFVAAGDLSILLDAWGSADAATADVDGDGIVDANDLAALLSAWGPCGGTN
ncbi:MAG: hypothetical protein RI967_1391 [Planctomycetota bacterium]